jgi:hypothetical protein
MATINPVITQILGGYGTDDSGHYIAGTRYQWGPMANGDVGAPAVNAPGFPDRAMQVFGTFGTGGSVAAEGSNEATPTNWAALTDPQGNTIAIGSAGVKTVTEATINFRPHVTAGDGSTSLTVILFFRNTQQRP